MIAIFLILATGVQVSRGADFFFRVARLCPNTTQTLYDIESGEPPQIFSEENETNSFYIQRDFSWLQSTNEVLEIAITFLENASWTFISDQSMSKNLSLGVDYEISARNTYLFYPKGFNLNIWLRNLTFLIGQEIPENLGTVYIYFYRTRTSVSPSNTYYAFFRFCLAFFNSNIVLFDP